MNLALKEARESHYWLRLVRDSKLVKINLDSHIQKADYAIVRSECALVLCLQSRQEA